MHRTRDGVTVVTHDPDLKRLCGDERLVSEVDYADLPPVRRRVATHFEGGERFFEDPSVSEGERRLATLEEVFRDFPDVAVNVDVKVHDERLVRDVSDLVRRFGRESRTVWGNYKAETVQLCHSVNPRIGILVSLKRVLKILLLFYTGLLPFLPVWETHLEIPMISVMRRPGQTWTRRTIIAILDKILMRRSLFRHLRARGIPTYAWVLNTEEEFDRAFRCGVEGVMTDHPSRLREYLRRHPEYA